MKALVTGAAGFIGSNLVDRLIEKNFVVHGVDNFSTGSLKYLDKAKKNTDFVFNKIDLLVDNLSLLHDNYDYIFHMAANADIRGGSKNSKIDFEQNLIVTHKLLEFCKGLKKKPIFIFSSTAAALGEPKVFPTPEDIAIPRQTSLYGASKMACESIISAYSNTYKLESYAFRFVSVLGPRYSHGHVFDFMKKLKKNPNILEVLGNGTAEKSYLHVDDCLDGILLVALEARPAKNFDLPFEVFNLGVNETIKVAQSADFICKTMKLKPKIIYEKQSRGWIGDNPFVHLSVEKIFSLGWSPKYSIKKSIVSTLNWLSQNPEVFKNRE